MEKYVITMLGEKDHGKSTLIGNMLIHTGHTTEARINEVKKTAKSNRFEPAHILDSFSEEREQEMTIDTTRAELVYKKAIFELIDVPGHLELIKNMMSGASNSDMAILMVSAKEGEGFKPQTKRHIFLSSMFGIKALVVAVNKMDYVNYDRGAFEHIKEEVSDYLKSINFHHPVEFVPISAYNNENLTTESRNIGWYKGKPLFEIVSEFARKYSKAMKRGGGLRAVVQDSMDMGEGLAHFGVLYNGTIRKNERVRVEPEGVSASVKKLYVKGKSVANAKEGTNIAIVFDKNMKLEKGSVVYDRNGKPHRNGAFEGKLFIIRDISPKSRIKIRINNHDVTLKSMKMRSIFSPISGETTKAGSTARANNVVYAGIRLSAPYPMEKYSEYNELGRFALYDGNEFAGVGIVE